jgi:predicted transcriptional regulator
VALEIEAELRQSAYHATAGELAGIQRGLEAAERDQFATDEEVKAIFAKYPRS